MPPTANVIWQELLVHPLASLQEEDIARSIDRHRSSLIEPARHRDLAGTAGTTRRNLQNLVGAGHEENIARSVHRHAAGIAGTKSQPTERYCRLEAGERNTLRRRRGAD